jgi:hypothetical protein
MGWLGFYSLVVSVGGRSSDKSMLGRALRGIVGYRVGRVGRGGNWGVIEIASWGWSCGWGW